MAIKVSAMTPRTVYLTEIDPEGRTYVVIRPPTFKEHTEREEFLAANRRITISPDGAQVISTTNVATLTALELWLTYDSTNLQVEFVDDDGNVVKTISFPPKDKIQREKFMALLMELPEWIIRAWHNAVVQVVPEWGIPF